VKQSVNIRSVATDLLKALPEASRRAANQANQKLVESEFVVHVLWDITSRESTHLLAKNELRPCLRYDSQEKVMTKIKSITLDAALSLHKYGQRPQP